MQRYLDIVFSGLALVVLTPLLLPVVLVLRLTGEGEVFFRQRRVGRLGKPFGLIKFATMLKDSPNLGSGTVTLQHDPRVLPFGRFLRATKINELPQLVNVIRGDMSVIGPRPQEQRCFDAFPPDSQREIVKVRPGLSGIGSIVFRAEERMMGEADEPERFYDEIIMPYKGEIEQWYVANQSARLYFTLIFLTVWAVLFSDSSLHWRVLDNLPRPPEALATALERPET